MTDYSWLYGENKVQNVTVINANVSESMPQFLEANFANESLDRSRIYGTTLGRNRGTPHSLLSLRRYEPVFHHRNASRLTGREEIRENSVSVFQALNGMYVDARSSPEQFRREFRCAGMSMTDYDFDLGEQTPSGVAVAIAGSMDIVNNSPYTWRPGDRLVFVPPPLDRATYNAFKKSMPQIEGEDPARVRFIIQPVRFCQQRLWFEHTLTEFYSDNGHVRFTIDRMFDSDSTMSDPKGSQFRAANDYINFIRSVMYVTIAALMNAGIQDLNINAQLFAGGAIPNDADTNTYNATRTALNRTLGEISTALADGLENHRANLARALRAWQLLLGLVPINAMGPDSAFASASTLVQFVVGCVSRNALASPEAARYHDILNIFSDRDKAGAFRPVVSANGSVRMQPNLDDRLGALHHIISSSLGGTLRGFKNSVEDLQNAYVATANSVTEPSNPGNVRRS